MYKNRKANRWEATDPNHLIGWTIQSIEASPVADRGETWAVCHVYNNMNEKDKRVLYVRFDMLPTEVVGRSYPQGG